MRRSAQLCLLTAAMALAQGVGPSEVLARPAAAAKDEARERYDRGVELFKEGDYRAALIEFERAYELAPHYRVLYNIGQVRYVLKDYAKALTVLSDYLEQGGDRITAKRRRSVEEDLKKLRPRVAQLRVEIDVSGAEVLVDDVPVGRSPLAEALTVSAGRRKVTVAVPGQEPVSRYVDVAGSEEAAVSFDLVAPGPDADGRIAPGDREPGAASHDEGRPDDYLWIGWVVTGALSVSSFVTSGLALDASGDLEDAQQRQTSREELDDLSSRTLSLSVATDVLMVGSVVAAGVTALVLLTREPPSSMSGGGEPAATWRFEVGPSPGGAGFHVRF